MRPTLLDEKTLAIGRAIKFEGAGSVAGSDDKERSRRRDHVQSNPLVRGDIPREDVPGGNHARVNLHLPEIGPAPADQGYTSGIRGEHSGAEESRAGDALAFVIAY